MPPLPESAVVNLVCALALTSTVTERLQSFDDRVKIEYQPARDLGMLAHVFGPVPLVPLNDVYLPPRCVLITTSRNRYSSMIKLMMRFETTSIRSGRTLRNNIESVGTNNGIVPRETVE